MFLRRLCFIIFLVLLGTSFLMSQDISSNVTTTIAPEAVIVNVTTAKSSAPVTDSPTTASAILIVEESTSSPTVSPSKADVSTVATTTTTTTTTTITSAPVVPEIAPKPVATTTKAPETINETPEVVTKAHEITTKTPETTTKAPEITTNTPETTTKAPEITTNTPETTTKIPETTTKAQEIITTTSKSKSPEPVLPEKSVTPTTESSDSSVTKAPETVNIQSTKSTVDETQNNNLSFNEEKLEKLENNTVKNVEIDKITESTNIAQNSNKSNVVIIEHSKPARNAKLFSDFMPDDIRNNGGVVVHILLLVYICLSLGLICDGYFLSSLEFISKSLNIPSDIAGATFMAIGTSAPELFTSIIGVFLLEDDIGTGTILGSAVFNLIFITSVCGLVVWKYALPPPKISKYSILRDCLFYFVTITTLLLVLKDNEVDWVESLCMLGLFGVYLIIMYYNAKIGELVKTEAEQTPLLSTSHEHSPTQEWQIEKSSNDDHEIVPTHGRQRKYSIVTDDGDFQADSWINSSKTVKTVMFPAIILFKFTLPKPNRIWYPVTFMISIVWISILSYIAVYLVDIIGYTFGIPETVAGLTILAAGTSFPELISSALVVKRAGLADMAICNLIGSNIFDILICLGLPWFVKSLISMISLGTFDLIDTMVPIQSLGFSFTTFSLLITIILFITILSCFKWKLGFGVGLTFFILYILFITFATLNEFIFN